MVLSILLGTLQAALTGALTPPISRVSDTLAWKEAQALASVLWVDARSEADYRRSHVPGAVHLPPEVWNEKLGALLERLTGEETLVCYCNPGCGSAGDVARRLRELGLERVHVLEGGYREGRFHAKDAKGAK